MRPSNKRWQRWQLSRAACDKASGRICYRMASSSSSLVSTAEPYAISKWFRKRRELRRAYRKERARVSSILCSGGRITAPLTAYRICPAWGGRRVWGGEWSDSESNREPTDKESVALPV